MVLGRGEELNGGKRPRNFILELCRCIEWFVSCDFVMFLFLILVTGHDCDLLLNNYSLS